MVESRLGCRKTAESRLSVSLGVAGYLFLESFHSALTGTPDHADVKRINFIRVKTGIPYGLV